MSQKTREIYVRVVYVIPGAVYGGAHNQVAQLAPKLREHGIEVFVLIPNETGNAGDLLTRAGVEWDAILLRRLRDPRHLLKNFAYLINLFFQFFRLRRYFKSVNADVVQVHGITQVDVAAAARSAGIPVIWQLLDTRAPQILCAAIRPFLQRLSSVVMSTGTATLKAHLGQRAARPPVVCYFPPKRSDLGVVTPRRRQEARRALGVGNDSVLIVSVGNFNPQKGHKYLLSALEQMDDVGIDLRIRGSISPQHLSYFEDLKARAIDTGLSDRAVSAMEAAFDVPEVLVAADIFCLPSESRSEGIPTILLEAMSIGVPVVAANVGSVAELVQDGVQGILHEPGDIKQIGDAISKLVQDGLVRARFAEAGRRRVEEIDSYSSTLSSNLDAIRLASTPLKRAAR